MFGWRFEAWGPPGFYLIHTGTAQAPGIGGALQSRAKPAAGEGLRGFECTVGVEDVDAIAAAVVVHGGRITMPRFRIETVGDLIWIEDTEGNRIGAMQYDADHGG